MLILTFNYIVVIFNKKYLKYAIKITKLKKKNEICKEKKKNFRKLVEKLLQSRTLIS